MKDWKINVILIALTILVTGMLYMLHIMLNQHQIIKSALIEALEETYEAAAE